MWCRSEICFISLLPARLQKMPRLTRFTIVPSMSRCQTFISRMRPKHTAPKVATAILGVLEPGFFVGSVVRPSNEELFSIIADSTGTVFRCIDDDDDEWDGEATSEAMGSTVVVVKIVADQIKNSDFEPVTKACLSVASLACTGTDLDCSFYGLVACVGKVVQPKK
ncbi:hypothetical protein B0H67DRAFT_680687 [Lasiosphaeris hirsuta]|uniref:Uncharacterized protein n=1 Tax=Lasiosphaeris hirsuta TaxID=260670 RepID=A0AA40B0A9_9PEZI|nr:hypothetical protein B0H67DRAFT_680687 [Lasiosphaeris hirsuta]